MSELESLLTNLNIAVGRDDSVLDLKCGTASSKLKIYCPLGSLLRVGFLKRFIGGMLVYVHLIDSPVEDKQKHAISRVVFET